MFCIQFVAKTCYINTPRPPQKWQNNNTFMKLNYLLLYLWEGWCCFFATDAQNLFLCLKWICFDITSRATCAYYLKQKHWSRKQSWKTFLFIMSIRIRLMIHLNCTGCLLFFNNEIKWNLVWHEDPCLRTLV